MRGHTLVAAVLHVPVFALHSWIGAAGSYADVWSGGRGRSRGGCNVHLDFHLSDKTNTELHHS